MNLRKKAAYFIGFVIVVVAFFKYWLLNSFALVVSGTIEFMGGDPLVVLNFLNANSNYQVYQDHYLGWFLYYPLYLGCHFVFIYVLFEGKTRKRVFFWVTVVITALLAFIALGKFAGLPALFEISFALFQNLFALPFVLLVLEGGRILLSDIDKKMGEN